VTEQGPYSWQDDFAILGGLLGFRADEPSPTTLAAGANTVFNAPLVGSGIINTTTDVDVFQFTTGGGQVQIIVKAAPIGANLIPRAELWSASTLIQTGTFDGWTPSLLHPKTSVIDVNLPAGTYYLRVKGGGDYGDMGQYSVSIATPLKGAVVGDPGGTTRPPVVGTVDQAATTSFQKTNLATIDSKGTPYSPVSAGASDGEPAADNDAPSWQSDSATSKARRLVSSTGRLLDELSPEGVDAIFASFDQELT
jgi:hypothetical protein